LVPALLAAILVVGLVAAVQAAYHLRLRATESAREAGLAAARVYAKDLLSYDYRHLDQDFARAKAHLVGEVVREYEATTAGRVLATARSSRAVVEAEVMEASVVSASPDRVVTLLLVAQRTRNATSPAPRLDRNRIRLSLAKVDGTWKVSGFDAI
jgi:Mce-associated membrane protein